MNTNNVNTIKGVSGEVLADSSVAINMKHCDKIISRYGFVDIDVINDDDDLDSATKKRWLTAAYIYLQKHNIKFDMEHAAKLCSNIQLADFVIKDVKVKKSIMAIIPKEQRNKNYLDALENVKNYGGYENHWILAIIAAYSVQPPLRDMEYAVAIVVDNDDELKKWEKVAEKDGLETYIVPGVKEKQYFNIINLRTRKMTVNRTKNIKKIGQTKIDLVDEFVDALAGWKKEFVKMMGTSKIPWLATSPRKKNIGISAWTKKVKEYNEGCATALRKNYSSDLEREGVEGAKQIEYAAKQMLHSPITNELRYNVIKKQ